MITNFIPIFLKVILLLAFELSNAANCGTQKKDLYKCLEKCESDISLTCLRTKCLNAASDYSICKNNVAITVTSSIIHFPCVQSRFKTIVQCFNNNSCQNIKCLEDKCDSKVDSFIDCFA